MVYTGLQFYREQPFEMDVFDDAITVLEEYDLHTAREVGDLRTAVESAMSEEDSITFKLSGQLSRVQGEIESEKATSRLRISMLSAEKIGDWLVLAELGSKIVSQAGFEWGVAGTQKDGWLDSFEAGFLTILGESLIKDTGRNQIRTAPAFGYYETENAIAILAGVHEHTDKVEEIEQHLSSNVHRRSVESSQSPIEFQEPSIHAGSDLIDLLKDVGAWDRDSIGWNGVTNVPDALERLQQLLREDSRADVRAEAAWAIGYSYQESETAQRQMDSLVEHGLTDESPKVRTDAANGISSLVSDVHEPLEEAYVEEVREIAFADPDPEARAGAVDALSNYSDYVTREKRANWFEEIYETDPAVSPRIEALGAATIITGSLELLFDGITSEHSGLQNEAASVMAVKAGTGLDDEFFQALPEYEEELYRALGHRNSAVRKAAAATISHLESDAVVPLLIATLKDRDEEVRGKAAYALRNCESPVAVDPLITRLDEDTAEVQKRAAWALGDLAEKYQETVTEAAPALIECLESSDSEVKEAAAGALGKLKTPDAADSLLDLLEMEETDTFKIVKALGELGATDRLIHRFQIAEGRERRIVARGLAHTGDSQAFEPLVQAWRDDNHRDFLDALSILGDERAVHPLLASLWACNPSVTRPLGKLGEPAVQPLLDILNTESGSPQYYAAEALGFTDDKRVFRPLLEALASPDPRLRSAILDGLSHYHDTRLCPVFRQLSLLDPDEDVRSAADEALRAYAFH